MEALVCETAGAHGLSTTVKVSRFFHFHIIILTNFLMIVWLRLIILTSKLRQLHFIYTKCISTDSPVHGDDSEVQHSGGAEKPVQELDSFAQQECMNPQAAQGTGIQGYVKGHTHQASTNARTRQVLDEEICDRLEDIGVTSAPQHCNIAWGQRDEKEKRLKVHKPRSVFKDTQFNVQPSSHCLQHQFPCQ